MKKYCCFFVPFLLLAFIFPILTGFLNPRKLSAPESAKPYAETPIMVSCLNCETNTLTNVNLEEYLVGVLAAEMPASYEAEALKAQAVAARSYILSKLNTLNPDHPNATICTSSNHCKGWLSESNAKSKWNFTEKNQNWKKLQRAVSETVGEYMSYSDQAIEAFFFASSGGRTENSEDVWQQGLPYLRSVESPEPAEEILSQVSLTSSQFIKKINPHLDKPLSENTAPWFSDIARTQGGSVASINICGKTFSGTEVRRIFELKSANFTISIAQGTVDFNVLGYGHGVGMSQKGANQLAKQGKSYTEILSHYYTNIQIVKM